MLPRSTQEGPLCNVPAHPPNPAFFSTFSWLRWQGETLPEPGLLLPSHLTNPGAETGSCLLLHSPAPTLPGPIRQTHILATSSHLSCPQHSRTRCSIGFDILEGLPFTHHYNYIQNSFIIALNSPWILRVFLLVSCNPGNQWHTVTVAESFLDCDIIRTRWHIGLQISFLYLSEYIYDLSVIS